MLANPKPVEWDWRRQQRRGGKSACDRYALAPHEGADLVSVEMPANVHRAAERVGIAIDRATRP